MTDKPYLFSVVICTYNRSALLRTALETLCTQQLAKSAYEVIVVDNNSTDDTGDVVAGFSERLPNLRYCFERQFGLSIARNQGWRLAQGRYVAFTDDDSRLPAEWLTKAEAIVQMHAPAAFGGPYFACYNGPKPAWFKDRYGSAELSDQVKTDTNDLRGPNIFLRRDLLAVTGGFDANLGLVGKRLAYGEERALLQVLRERCPQALIYYDPHLYVYHLVRPEKMRLGWQLRRHFINGRSLYRVMGATYLPLLPPMGQARRLLKTLLRLLLVHSWRLMRRNRVRYPYYQQYIVEAVVPDLRKLGGLVEQFQQTLARRTLEDETP